MQRRAVLHAHVILGYSRKNPHPPDGWGRFLTPPEAQDPPSCLDFQDKTPPLPPGFPGKNARLKFNLLLIENTHNHI